MAQFLEFSKSAPKHIKTKMEIPKLYWKAACKLRCLRGGGGGVCVCVWGGGGVNENSVILTFKLSKSVS